MSRALCDVAIRAQVPLEAVRRHVPYWVSNNTKGPKGVHVPAVESSREEPLSLCHQGNSSESMRSYDVDIVSDTHLEDRICGACARELIRDGRISLPNGVRNSALSHMQVEIVGSEGDRR